MKNLFQKLLKSQAFITILGLLIIFGTIGGFAFAQDFNKIEAEIDPSEALNKMVNVEGDINGGINIYINKDKAEATIPEDNAGGGSLHNYVNPIFVNGLRAGTDRKQVVNSDGNINFPGTDGNLVMLSTVTNCTDATTTSFAIASPYSSGSATIISMSYYQSGVATATMSIDIGVASDAYTSSDNLIDGLSIATSTTAYEASGYGTNGKTGKSIDSTEYVTGTITTLYPEAITNTANTYACTVEILFMQ